MRGKWVFISVLAVCLGVGGAAFSARRRRVAPETAGRNPGAAAIANPEISLNGVIRPQHFTGVGSAIEGNIDAFMANVGDEVFQGQVLARIGAAGLESEREAAAHAVEYAQDQVSRAEAGINAARMEASRATADEARARMALDRAQKVYERQKTLHAAGATPRLTFEKAEQDYEAAQKEEDIMEKGAQGASSNVQAAIDTLNSAKKVLAEKSQQLEDAQGAFESAEVRAPVDGLIVSRKGDVGKPVQESGDQLFQIATDLYALEVPIEPQADVLKRLHPGQPALVVVLDLQTGGMPGSVKEIKDTQAIIEFTSTLPAIRPGMRADVRLKLE
ncbi:MAG TPA: HlyD family efflux transporter periplasmic adaptor subunit [Bryobacteraceae bacterium]|nr:HlyD family efflux transporter periplasmic adaptor subunit [Bryobacteraceae bacterium]